MLGPGGCWAQTAAALLLQLFLPPLLPLPAALVASLRKTGLQASAAAAERCTPPYHPECVPPHPPPKQAIYCVGAAPGGSGLVAFGGAERALRVRPASLGLQLLPCIEAFMRLPAGPGLAARLPQPCPAAAG